MKKHSFYLFFTLLFLAINVFGQFNDDEYKQQAEEIRKGVWNSKIHSFDQRSIPGEYEKFSKVILARHEEITCLAKPKVKLVVGYGFKKMSQLTYTRNFRELVKINDVTALNEYSEMSFQKFHQYFKDKQTTFLGLRVIKPDGSIKEVNPDDVVFTEDKKYNKRGKLAVPDLQLGDMIDYFFETVAFYSTNDYDFSEQFVFAEEDPMLHYSVHIEINNKIAVKYGAINGAPVFTVARNGSDNVILDVEQTNITRLPLNLWLSPYRQVPVLRLNMSTILPDVNFTDGNVLKIEKSLDDSPSDNLLTSWSTILSNYKLFAKQTLTLNRGKIKKLAESYLQKNGGGNIENNSRSIYYAARHFFFLKPDNNISFPYLSSYNSRTETIWFLSTLHLLLKEYKFNPQFILLPSKYGSRPGEAIVPSDFNLALLTNDKHIYTAETVFDLPDQIPYYLEGQHAINLSRQLNQQVVAPQEDNNNIHDYNIQASPPDKNIHTENLLMTFYPDKSEKIKIQRKVTLTGNTKLERQRLLLLYEDFYEEEGKMIGSLGSLIDDLSSSNNGRKRLDEYRNILTEERKEWKEDFKEEIEMQFNTKPEELFSYNLQQAGIFTDKPEFIYTTVFTVNEWIKTAGDNYLIEVGRVVRPEVKLKPEYRERKEDIYMPYARTFKYNIQIPVPHGFTVDGIDKLNRKLENTVGSFTTSATLESETIMITTIQTFRNAFEKADKWPELLAVLDAAEAFREAKILFKKL